MPTESPALARFRAAHAMLATLDALELFRDARRAEEGRTSWTAEDEQFRENHIAVRTEYAAAADAYADELDAFTTER